MALRLGIAAGNPLGVQAATEVAHAGGNAIDACLAAAVMAWVAEPFFASIGGGGFIAVRRPGMATEIIDGNTGMPQTPPAEPGQSLRRIFVPDYADGIYMGIGAGSVGVPGVLAAVRTAWERHGRIEWPALFAPAITAARSGIPFPRTSSYYLSCTWQEIWSLDPGSSALFAVDGRPFQEGDHFVQPELADTLEQVADGGPSVFYSGALAGEIAAALAEGGGFLGSSDLDVYRPEVRAPIASEIFGWRVESNPPPAVGGVGLAHMLALLDATKLGDPLERLRAIVGAQRSAMGFRSDRYQDPADVANAWEDALNGMRSPSTTHTSTADSDGAVCSFTESIGYGAGIVVHGILLNNSLGEEELNPLGVHRLLPGSRCHSNMAPTVATGPERTVVLGSPGASRIVGAIGQTLIRLALDGDSLAEAVSGARAHFDLRPEGETLCFEPGLPGEDLTYIARPYDDIHMYFGAVQAASVTPDGAVDAAHDPRRSGASVLV